MRIRHQRSSPSRELVRRDPASSFAAYRLKPTSFPFVWHYHPEVELTLIVRGIGLRFIGDSIEPFGPGDLILIGGNVPHTWQSTHASEDQPSTLLEAIVIQFPSQMLGDAMGSLPELQSIRRMLNDAARGLCVEEAKLRARVCNQIEKLMVAPLGSVDRLLHLIEALQSIAEGAKRGRKAVRFVSTLPRDDARDGDPSTVRLERVLRSLHESLDIGNRLTQADAATLVNMSPAAFSRFFHRKVGRTFVRYVKEWRVELACRELLQTARPITAIAFDCGFDNLSNFNRRFREYKGMTPREFRRLR